MDNCKHIITSRPEDAQSGWCIECGGKVYKTEDRECKGCEHYANDSPFNTAGICKKHLMRVPSTMHVYYKILEGTCFKQY